MVDIITMIKPLEDLNELIDGTTEKKQQQGKFLPALLAPWATSLVQQVISSVVKGRGVTRAGKGYVNKNF